MTGVKAGTVTSVDKSWDNLGYPSFRALPDPFVQIELLRSMLGALLVAAGPGGQRDQADRRRVPTAGLRRKEHGVLLPTPSGRAACCCLPLSRAFAAATLASSFVHAV